MGFGHLGKFFAKEISSDHQLDVTYRSKIDDNFSHSRSYHYDTELHSDFNFDDDYDFVIWSFTPFDNYSKVLEKADKFFHKICKWIYIGSTGVFGEGEITENSDLSLKTKRSARLASIEKTLNFFDRDILIIRPSGLIDEKRSPKNWASRLNKVSRSNNEMNLVYTKDVARFINYAIDNKLMNDSFNLSASHHPVKSDFYRNLLEDLAFKNLILDNRQEAQKTISNQKSLKTGFRYLIDENLYDLFKN